MRKELELASVMPANAGKPNGTSKRPAVGFLLVGAWTVFVVLALWWLLRGNSGPAVYIIRNGDPGQHATFENFRAWFKEDWGLQRAYPWVLFGPYVALIAAYFPLERGKLRLNLVLNLAACVGFIAACRALSVRTSLRGATVVLLRSQGQINNDVSGPPTNRVMSEVIKREWVVGNSELSGPAGMGKNWNAQQLTGTNQGPAGFPFERTNDVLTPGSVRTGLTASGVGLSNLLAQMQPGPRRGLPPKSARKFWRR